MKSHLVEFTPSELLRQIAGPMVAVGILALGLHLGARMQWLPRPRPALDSDRTVILHQADSSRERTDAEVVLLGDSSCLMDVDARRLTELLGRRVLNLGLNSHLDLAAQATLLGEFQRSNPGQPRVVILLMHPEALRRAGSEPYPLAVLTHYLAGTDHFRNGGVEGQILRWSGAEIFRGRYLSRIMPSPLGGSFGRFYGFSPDLENYMTRRNGSAVDPGDERPSGSAEYRLNAALEKSSREFRTAMLVGTKLFVGITPVPTRFAGAGYPAHRDEMLREWTAWLQADELLLELPAAMPEEQMIGTRHLKPSAVQGYTEKLAEAIGARLR